MLEGLLEPLDREPALPPAPVDEREPASGLGETSAVAELGEDLDQLRVGGLGGVRIGLDVEKRVQRRIGAPVGGEGALAEPDARS